VKLNLFLLLTILPALCYSQIVVQGTVTNAITKKPIADVSVYINNSGIGTTTKIDGSFELKSNGQIAEVIISHISYEKQTLTVSSSSKALKILLKEKTDDLNEVAVRTKNKENRKKWGKLFTESFLGTGYFAEQTEIVNPEVLWFRYNKNTQTVTAKARQPVLIKNKALGYITQIELDSFYYSFQSNLIYRLATTFYTDIQPKNEAQRKEFASNRLLAYQGSKMHFFRSLYAGNAEKEGFSIYKFVTRTNDEKKRIQQMLTATQAKLYESNSKDKDNAFVHLTSNKDSANYYTQVLRMPDYVFYDSVFINAEKRIETGPTVKKFLFGADTLLIIYNGKRDSAFIGNSSKAAKIRGLSRDIRQQYNFFRHYTVTDNQYSLLRLMNGTKINFEANGFVSGALLHQDGYMSWKKIAQQLPWDYDPKVDSELLRK
jgi:hypothetical protein